MGHLFDSVCWQPGGLRAWRCLGPGGLGGRISSSSCAGLSSRAEHGSKRLSPIVLLVDVQPRKWAGSRADCEPRGWRSSQAASQGPGDSGQCRGEAGGEEGRGRGGPGDRQRQTCPLQGFFLMFLFCCRCSVARLRLTCCDPINCSTPGFPVPEHPPELAQTHVRWVAVLSHPLSSPSPPALNLSQHQGLFQEVGSSFFFFFNLNLFILIGG